MRNTCGDAYLSGTRLVLGCAPCTGNREVCATPRKLSPKSGRDRRRQRPTLRNPPQHDPAPPRWSWQKSPSACRFRRLAVKRLVSARALDIQAIQSLRGSTPTEPPAGSADTTGGGIGAGTAPPPSSTVCSWSSAPAPRLSQRRATSYGSSGARAPDELPTKEGHVCSTTPRRNGSPRVCAGRKRKQEWRRGRKRRRRDGRGGSPRTRRRERDARRLTPRIDMALDSQAPALSEAAWLRNLAPPASKGPRSAESWTQTQWIVECGGSRGRAEIHFLRADSSQIGRRASRAHACQ